jgi:hypothetical protein
MILLLLLVESCSALGWLIGCVKYYDVTVHYSEGPIYRQPGDALGDIKEIRSRDLRPLGYVTQLPWSKRPSFSLGRESQWQQPDSRLRLHRSKIGLGFLLGQPCLGLRYVDESSEPDHPDGLHPRILCADRHILAKLLKSLVDVCYRWSAIPSYSGTFIISAIFRKAVNVKLEFIDLLIKPVYDVNAWINNEWSSVRTL